MYSADEIIKICASEFSIKSHDLLNRSRLRKYCYPRHVACYLLFYNNYKITLTEMGKIFGKHPSTIMYNIKLIKILMSVDNKIKQHIEYIIKKHKIENNIYERKYRREDAL